MTKFIVVAGGVISGVGKGVTSASIAKILKEYGFKVTAIKIDPYINYDAGTLRPTEHGEVWVTDDGGEIDQDLGNYERFLDVSIPKKNNITTGQIYKTVIDNERAGKYLGKTVQFIPHIPNEIKRRIKDASKDHDFCVIEIGGTIGDYENIPFLFAMRSLEIELGKENVVHVLITYLPVPSHIDEMKTKPTQQAIKLLTEHGIMPDFIICRAHKALDAPRKKKIEIYANIASDHVISEPDIDTIYRIPLDLEKEKFGEKLLEKFNIKPKKQPDWKKWKKLVDNIADHGKEVKIAMVCKYLDIGDYQLSDSYISINQALMHAAANLNIKVKIDWIDAKTFEKNKNKVAELKNYKGIIVPGGFGGSGVEGKIMAIKYARENDIPFLGLCYGMQLAIVEFARNVCNMEGANTTEVDEKTAFPVIDILASQKKVMEESRYGATMRLGAYAAMLKDKSKVFELYNKSGRSDEDSKLIKEFKDDAEQSFRLGILEKGKEVVLERHRHRYEVNPQFVAKLEEKGLVFSGYHIRKDNEKLMEFIELPNLKYFVATQAHPEFKSTLTDPAPLFYGFVKSLV
ncbi:MAG: CTP synthase (glutamine hydrolyzing) [Nanoarchaeota archaeon]